MGQPKHQRKKYETPNHPWQGDRIKAENEVVRKFGLKNKREIWRAQTRLREIRGQARGLISRSRNPDDVQAKKEAGQLLARLHRQGYTGEGATLNEVLGLDVERILNRRLQSQVYLKGMARTMNQARQFVVHGSVRVGDRRVTIPGYVVPRGEEERIAFDPDAPVADENHPVRPKAAAQEAIESVRQREPAEAPAAPTPEAGGEAPKAAKPETPAVAPTAGHKEAAPAKPETPAAEATPAPSRVQEESKPTARPDAHPAERNEAPAGASEEPNVTEIAPAEPEATAKPETPEPEAEAAKPEKEPAPTMPQKEAAKPQEEPEDAASEDEAEASGGGSNEASDNPEEKA